MKKGSLSVFFAMVLSMVMTLIFTMAECIRAYELHSLSQEYTDMAVESAFSEYNPYLWSNYKILALDLGYGTDNIGSSILESKTLDYCKFNASIDSGFNYARLNGQDCKASYSVLTDNSCKGVILQGKKAVVDEMSGLEIDKIQSQFDQINSIEKVDVEKIADSGIEALEKAKAKQLEKKSSVADEDDYDANSSDYEEPGTVEDNPLEAFEMIRESFSSEMLATVTSVQQLSNAEYDLNQLPSHRSLNQGDMNISVGSDIVDKALFTDYLMTNYSHFGNDLKHDGMKYEIEYLIAGQETDTQNLTTVVNELMSIREAANYSTIMQNQSMVSQAASIAEVLAGFTTNPAIIDEVKNAVIAAWVYVESIIDIRLLLSGGRLPLIKNLETWTSDIWHLSTAADINFKARECKDGIAYSQYLIGFLAQNSDEILALRACDVMENALAETEDYKAIRMDNMIFAADFYIDYSSDSIFLSMLSKQEEDCYHIKKNKIISY